MQFPTIFVRRELKVLREHLKKALNENKQAKIKGLKLEIDSKLYTAKELEGLSDPDVSLSSSPDLEESSEGESEEEREKVKSKSGTSIAQSKNTKKRKQQKTPSPGGIKTRSNKKKKTARRF